MDSPSSDSKVKFWVFLIGLMIAVAGAITLIDITIKAAILQESNDLKRTLDNYTDGTLNARTRSTQTDTNGANHNPANNGSDDPDDVFVFPTRVEAPTVRSNRTRTAKLGAMSGTIEHSERNGNGGVATDSEPVDS